MLSKHVITTSKIYPVNIIFYQGVKYNNCGITQNIHIYATLQKLRLNQGYNII